MKSLKIGNVLKGNKIAGAVNRVKFEDSNNIYYELITNDIGVTFDSVQEMNTYLNKYEYKLV